MHFDTCDIRIERWPLRTPFRIARGAKTEAELVTVTLEKAGATGRGEACPYPRYGETPASTVAAIERALKAIESTPDSHTARTALLDLPPGSARNALDCALWDFEAKQTSIPVYKRAGLAPPAPVITCYTLSLDTPDAMAKAAREHADCLLLKLKLGDAPGDPARMRAVRRARPDARLVADANEGWRADGLPALLDVAAEVQIEVVEQPLPAADDSALRGFASPLPLCADESAAPGTDLAALTDRYQAINIKLDKTGGLTAALTAIAAARSAGCRIMLGSMVSTSLSMAAASHAAALADWVDLDSPLLLARDRPYAMTITNGQLSTPNAALWG